MDRYAFELYTEFLDYIQSRYAGQCWLLHPSEVARYWQGLRRWELGAQTQFQRPPRPARVTARRTRRDG